MAGVCVCLLRDLEGHMETMGRLLTLTRDEDSWMRWLLLEGHMEDRAQDVLVATYRSQAGTVLGWATGYVTLIRPPGQLPRPYLEVSCYVEPFYRGQGIGRALIGALRGCTEYPVVGIPDPNGPGVALYQACNVLILGEEPNGWDQLTPLEGCLDA